MDNHELGGLSWNSTRMEDPAPGMRVTDESRVMLILGCCLCGAIILTNFLLAASLVAGKNFNTFTVCVFHMMAVDLLIGACVFPLSVATEFYHGTWIHGDIVCSFWVTLDTFLPILIIVSCSLINIERLLELSRPTYRLWRELWSWKHFLFIWIPWLTVFAVGVPLYVVGINPDNHTSPPGMCFVDWEKSFYLIFNILLYFVPLFLAVVCLIAAVVCSIRAACTTYEEDPPRGTLSSAVALVLVTMSVILMMLPFITLSFVSMALAQWSGEIDHFVFTTLYWISLANSAVRPLCWLFDPEIRLGYAALCRKCCCCWKSESAPLHGVSLTKA